MADIVRDIVLLTVKEEEISELIGDGDAANMKKQMKFAVKWLDRICQTDKNIRWGIELIHK